LLDKLLARCRALGLLKARGPQRMDATHVLAAIRALIRLELVAETLREALNDLATIAPAWLQSIVPPEWYERYGKRIEDVRLPREQAKRETYAQTGRTRSALSRTSRVKTEPNASLGQPALPRT
jgi:transposase